MTSHPALRSFARVERQLSLMPAGSQPVATSEDAADMQTPDRLGRMRRKVLLYIAVSLAGMTADEVASGLDLPHNSVAPRFTELAAMGFIERTAARHRTRSGGSAFVYITTAAGGRLLESEK